MFLYKKVCYVIALLFLCVGMAMAQTTITGTVISADDNEPMIGVNILVDGTQIKTITNIEGKFTLKDVKPNAVLVVSMIGMRTERVKAKNGMRIVLHNDEVQMSEVIVNGQQQIDKRLFTGAATTVDAEKIKLSGLADVSRSLEGRVAGVQVTNVSGTFGASPKIRVRGATSIYGNSKPLWVVDGVIYEDNVDVSADDLASGDAKTLISSAVAGLNSDDIESFTVLKDGSATSIYGARAMGGVIVVTTKKGSKGRASVGYTGELTTRFKPSYNDYNIMNSQEIMGVYKEMYDKGWLQLDNMVNAQNTGVYGYMFQQLRKYDPVTGTYGLQNTEAARNAYLQAAEFRNTNWFDLLFTNKVQQNHSVSISGGTERSQNYFSMSVLTDPGQFVNRSMVNRYTFNGNTAYDILKGKKWCEVLTVKLAAQGSYRKQEAPGTLDRTTDVVTGEVKRDFDINPFSFAMNTSRCLDPNLRYTRFYTGFNIFDELENNYNDILVTELMFRGELEYKPFKWLGLNGLISSRMSHTNRQHNVMDRSNQANAYRAGVDAQDDNSTIRDNNSLLYTDPDNELALPESVLPTGGIKYQYDDKMRSNNFRFMASYNNVFVDKIGKEHTLNGMVGTEYSSVRRTNTKWTGWGYQFENGGITYTPYLWLKQMNEENTEYFGESYTLTNTLAYYGQVNYNYDQRYTFNGTLRYEGTNRLGKSNQSRWLPTWNVSGSWDVTNEKFMARTKSWLSQLKFRASYSLTADTGPSWVTNANAIFMTKNSWRPFTSAAESQIYIKNLGNTELTYEKKHEWNLGIDVSFLKERIALTFDIYGRNNYDLIGPTYTQGAGGEIFKYANVADMESHGIELGLSTVNIDKAGFKWTSDFIFSKAKNKITSLNVASRAVDLVTGQGYAIEGYPVRSIFSYRFAGLNSEGLPQVYNERGQKTVGDVNFQETENLKDFLVYEGPSDPTFYGSFNNTFSYKSKSWGSLSLDLYITYSGGNVVRLDPVFSSSYSDLSALPREFKNRWMVAGDEAVTNIPTIASRVQVDRYSSTTLRTAYNAYNYSTERIAKGDFIRLKEVALTYILPDNWLKKTFISRASVKLAATNLCLLYADKKLNGQDPEFINSGGVAAPISKQFTATIRLGF
ncbi:MAG: SusC/RagA family TonB-linked outer membrane protein [Bacteroidaceae bacterium]|nr:SusC/RagA family TonB-linked outer membrane protein [Bacteroidaceae bacterium]